MGLLNQDLAQQFDISESLVTNIFHSWLRAIAEYLSAVVCMPDIEHILGTSPQRFREFKNLYGIIGIYRDPKRLRNGKCHKFRI